MHSRLIVLMNKHGAENSLEARRRVDHRLAHEHFVGEGSLFTSPPSDWFVIGGRWSGFLTELHLDQDKLRAFYKEFESQKLGWVGGQGRLVENQKAKSLGLFHQCFPNFEGKPPVWRDAYLLFGHEDDAQILDEVIFQALEKLSVYPGSDLYEGNCYVDFDSYDAVRSEDVGKKWVVIVDFHF